MSCSVQQTRLKTSLVSSDHHHYIYKLAESVTLESTNTADTHLKYGTTWTLVGKIEKGDVYQTKDQVVIVNSFNVYEAYIVVKGRNVVGYYLPIEKTFVKTIRTPIKLIQKEITNEK